MKTTSVLSCLDLITCEVIVKRECVGCIAIKLLECVYGWVSKLKKMEMVDDESNEYFELSVYENIGGFSERNMYFLVE